MSLEERLRNALHSADDYQPSVDLFRRMHRSIEEDQTHRRRIRSLLLWVTAEVTLIGSLLLAVARPGADGAPVLPKWSAQLVVVVVNVTILVALGPGLRRIGETLLEDVFHLSSETGVRFSRLLDIAYYLFFGGMIVIGFDPTRLDASIPLPSDELWIGLSQIAVFLLGLGLAHIANLVILPVIGLLFTSLTRRALRREAGTQAPPISESARRADRVATHFVIAVTVLAVGGLLVMVALALLALGIA